MAAKLGSGISRMLLRCVPGEAKISYSQDQESELGSILVTSKLSEACKAVHGTYRRARRRAHESAGR
jgi:hypothetical protein